MGTASQLATESRGLGPPTHKWLVALAVMMGTALEVLDNSIVNVALPHLQGSFSASIDEISWVVTSYFAANGIMIPMTGWIAARFGRKRYFMFSVLLFVVASALCGAARSLDQMVVFRLLQGVAGAAMVPLSQAILMETFPPREQQMAMATWGMGVMVVPIMGPTLGGWITENWNWRWNFYINIPIGVIALLMVSAFVHDPSYLRQRREGRGNVDYFGMAMLVLGLGLLQVVLDRGQRADWFDSAWVVYATTIAVAAIVLLVIQELRFGDPIVDLRILKSPDFTFSMLLIVAMSSVLFGTGLLGPVFLQEHLGYDAWSAGLTLAPRGLGTMVSMFLVGQLARTGFDTRPLIGLGFVLMAFSLWTMGHWNLQVSTWAVVWPSTVMGFAMGMIFPTLSAATLSCVPRERMGYASSLYSMMRTVGAAVGIAYLTNVLVSHQQTHQARLVEHFTAFDAWRMSQTAPPMPGALQFYYLPEIVTGQKQGIAGIYGMIQAQAAMLSYNDIYRTLAFIMMFLVPAFLLLRRVQQRTGDAPAH